MPPVYDISQIRDVPIYLYYSDSDWLATPQDVERHLLRKLNKSLVKQVVKLDGFNHNDFLWGLRAADELYRPIIEVIRRDTPAVSHVHRGPSVDFSKWIMTKTEY